MPAGGELAVCLSGGVTVTREVDGVPERVVVGPPQPGGSAVTTRVACLGDSLTRAQLSVDYLDLLVRRRPPGDVRLARFGVNGDFAYNLLRRLDAVVANPPEVITVLIGTNDARAWPGAGSRFRRPASGPARPRPPGRAPRVKLRCADGC